MKRKNNFTLNQDEIFRYSRQIVYRKSVWPDRRNLKNLKFLWLVLVVWDLFRHCILPWQEFVRQPDRFEKKDQIVLFCRSGVRSARAVVRFREKEFSNIRHLRGGIIAWIDEIDPSLPRY